MITFLEYKVETNGDGDRVVWVRKPYFVGWIYHGTVKKES